MNLKVSTQKILIPSCDIDTNFQTVMEAMQLVDYVIVKVALLTLFSLLQEFNYSHEK